ncbi:MAG: carbamoyl-phosphate synthase (glutamine-hydrolyzing) large subunit [Candidatus Levybacteria bacterium]|nr:carbamoyl-phosphate synthase (glutamine-hydrolyzing) large subunit [Candidatus Levybacteria bacterium]
MKKILILGSGALKIGEAGEFDYSGSQAIKALKEEGIETVLVNPNIATIQTSKFLADTVYFLPVNPYFVEKVIAKEKPDGIFLSFGGQTALNCGLALEESGVLKKYNVKVLGTPVSAIALTEDRQAFANHLHSIDVQTPQSVAVNSTEKALEIAKNLGYPVMVRAGFALGGQGSGIAKNEEELKKITNNAFSFVTQILVEQYLHHFKEIEYEVVRDKDDNCITICNMENFDPLGIHTGESIVVAPSQTLTSNEYHHLRSTAIKIVRSLGIVGECNVQFALNPHPKEKEIEYYVIEVNARLSRSSALASKATGYPLAYVAAKLALGQNLTEIKNSVTGVTSACFEPALDYIVTKIPRWDIEKFRGADEKIGSSMKSVGEVMGIGRTFEESFQKAIRMLDLDFEGVTSTLLLKNGDTVEDLLEKPTPKRMFAIASVLKKGMSISEIHAITGIDEWFLSRIKHIVDISTHMPKKLTEITKEHLWEIKRAGISDKRIGDLTQTTGLAVRDYRKNLGVIPSIFQIDTLAGEFPAKTNYLYVTYGGNHNDVSPAKDKGVIVLGSGPYRIGSSVEFDWTSVNTAMQLKDHDKQSIIINCNPETVSTDYDISERLYFEELTFERIADIYDFENPFGIIVSVGGQTPNNRAQSLHQYGAHILGTTPENINRAEDRSIFSKLLDDLEVDQPKWNKFTDTEKAVTFADTVGYPVLIRPSYVLSGTLMRICNTKEDLVKFLDEAAHVSSDYPLTVSKFIEEAKEIELDAVANNGEIKAFVISEHIENAGVHSGDASIVLPPQTLNETTQKAIEEVGRKLAKALDISGPVNIQFLAKDNNIQVIETNLRASRTFPFISKVTGVDFIKLAVDAFFGKQSNNVAMKQLSFVAVKVAQFSFARLTGADPILHVEMASTGEAACFGDTEAQAFLTGELAVGDHIPAKGIFLSLGGDENKKKFLKSVKKIGKLQLPLYATEGTAAFLKAENIAVETLHKLHDGKSPNVLEYFQQRKIDLVINLVEHQQADELDKLTIRRAAIDHNIPVYTNFQKARMFIEGITTYSLEDIPIRSWDEYTKGIL